jgi:cell division control protein 24
MHGFVALIKNVETLVDRLEAEGKLDLDSLPAGRTTRSSMDAKTNREKVVMELLETERKYVNDLERLQVHCIIYLKRHFYISNPFHKESLELN